MSSPNARVIDPIRAAHSQVAVAARRGRDLSGPRRNLATEKLRKAILDTLAADCTPTPAQRAELAELLVPGGLR